MGHGGHLNEVVGPVSHIEHCKHQREEVARQHIDTLGPEDKRFFRRKILKSSKSEGYITGFHPMRGQYSGSRDLSRPKRGQLTCRLARRTGAGTWAPGSGSGSLRPLTLVSYLRPSPGRRGPRAAGSNEIQWRSDEKRGLSLFTMRILFLLTCGSGELEK